MVTEPDVPDAPGLVVLEGVEWQAYCKLRDDGRNHHVRRMGETAWKPRLRQWARNLPEPPAAA